jgi:hypothetical protein
MDKLYSKTSLIIKAAFCLLIAPLCLVLADFSSVEDGFSFVVLTVLTVGCFFTLPFWTSAYYLKKYRTKSIKPFILWDAVVCLLPAVIGILSYDFAYTLINGTSLASGVVSLIFISVFVLITLVFWLFYFVLSKIK